MDSNRFMDFARIKGRSGTFANLSLSFSVHIVNELVQTLITMTSGKKSSIVCKSHTLPSQTWSNTSYSLLPRARVAHPPSIPLFHAYTYESRVIDFAWLKMFKYLRQSLFFFLYPSSAEEPCGEIPQRKSNRQYGKTKNVP